jgi:2-octaprenyl-6-methoxyphenol hydroxylase
MHDSDVIIVGGGLVGATLALALAAHDVTSTVIDAADLDKTAEAGFDGRASAIASASMRMLRAIGVLDRIEAEGCPIRKIEVSDGYAAPSLDFDSAAAEGEPLGVMFENRVLRAALIAAMRAESRIRLIAPARIESTARDSHAATVRLAGGETIRAPLLIAADGRRSKLREDAGIRIATWRYPNAAVVTMVEHALPHDNVAHEMFFPTGPFAVLPMLPGNRSAIVWTVRADEGAAVAALPERALAAEVDKRAGRILGASRVIAPAASWPLGYHRAETMTAERFALIGDAAHGIHPIAGQGLNMGLRDVAALAEVLADGVRLGLDPGDAQLLARYRRWRALDNMMVGAVTDGLNRLFAIPGRPAAVVRRFGMGAVQKLPALKSLFMAEARGTTGDLPRLLKGQLAQG